MRHLVLLALLALTLTGCGGSDHAESSPSAGRSTVDGIVLTDRGPTCASVFVEGATMPAEASDFCVDEENDTVSPTVATTCADGQLFLFNPLGYGVVGSEVHLPAAGEAEVDPKSDEVVEAFGQCLG